MTQEFDVFVSYDREHEAEVVRLCEELRDAGVRVWLDVWVLKKGDAWVREIEAALERARFAIVCFGPAGAKSRGWRDSEYQLIVDRTNTGQCVMLPVTLPGAKAEDLSGFARTRQWTALDDPLEWSDEVAALVEAIQQERERAGIIDFRTERARHEHFFGREDVLREIDGWITRHDSGWLLVTGGPGLGKSALLNEWLKRREQARARTAFHFIRRGHKSWADPQVVRRSLAAQIERDFGLQRGSKVESASRLEVVLDEVSAALVEADERLVLLVDGLDEAMKIGEQSPIPEIFPHELPERVFVLTASRPRYPHLTWIDRRGGPTARVDLDERSESNEEAVRAYWIALGPTMDPPIDEALIEAAIGGARGNLLHAVKLRQLWTGPAAVRSAAEVPQGFKGMLDELWERMTALPEPQRKIARDGLSLICAARESMPLSVVGELLGWGEDDAYDEFLPATREMLLEEPWHAKPAYRPFHEGLRALVAERRERAMAQCRARLIAYSGWPIGADAFRRSYSLRHRVAHLVEHGELQAVKAACFDLEFLTAKACVEGIHAVERDLVLATSAQTNEEDRNSLAQLERVVEASSHWATRVPSALPALVLDRALTHAPGVHRDLIESGNPIPRLPRLRHPLPSSGLSRILLGHEGRVNALATLPDGRLVSGSSDGTLRVWDVQTGRALAVLHGHNGSVIALATLPDGRVVSGSGDNSVRLWDLETGRTIAHHQVHQGPVNALAVLPDGRIASGSGDQTVWIWDVQAQRAQRFFRGQVDVEGGFAQHVGALALLPDGHLASASGDGMVRIWDPRTGRAIRGHELPASALAVLPDGRLVAGAWGGLVRVFDPKTGQTTKLQGDQRAVRALAVSPNGEVVSGSDDGTVRVWDVRSGGILATLRGHQGPVHALAVLPDGRILSGAGDATLRLWDARTDRKAATHEHHRGSVGALAVMPGGRVVSGSHDGTVRVWDVETGRSEAAHEEHQGSVSALAVMPDGRVVSGSADKTVRVWDMEAGTSQATLHGHQGRVIALTVLSDRRVASGSSDKTIRTWDVDARRALAVYKGQEGGIGALAAMPTGDVASGSWDKSLWVWNVLTGRLSRVLQGHRGRVNAAVALADGHVASGSSDRTVRVWDVETGRARVVLEGHLDKVNALAVLPDGCLVSGSSDKTVRVWDVATGSVVATVYGDASVYSVAVVGQELIVAGDALGNVWFVDLPDFD